MQQKILGIESLRALCILLVAASHWIYGGVLARLHVGHWGVDIFFVISGFLITQILLQSKEKIDAEQTTFGAALKRFYVRRTLRIFPIYYLVLLLCYLFDRASVLASLPWNLVYFSNFYHLMINDWTGSTSHFWSLAIEEQFYMVWAPIVLFLNKKQIKYTIIGLVLLGIGSRFFINTLNIFPFIANVVFTPCCLDTLGIGALFGYCWRYQPTLAAKILKQKSLFTATVLLFAGVTTLGYFDHNYWYILMYRSSISLVCIFLIGWSAQGWQGPWKYFFEHPFLVFLGKISYGFYLFHPFVPRICSIFTTNTSLLFYFVFTTALASLSFYCFEKPINDLRERV
jgi:peptidoglycan/LPS O-acetylase OafA/YrhL